MDNNMPTMPSIIEHTLNDESLISKEEHDKYIELEKLLIDEIKYVLSLDIKPDEDKALCLEKSKLKDYPLSQFVLRDRYGENGCETDPEWLQLITYTVVRDHSGNVLTYARGNNIKEARLASNNSLKTLSIGIGGHVGFDFTPYIKYNIGEDGVPINYDKENYKMILRTYSFLALSACTELHEEINIPISEELLLQIAKEYLKNPLNITPGGDEDVISNLIDVNKVHMGICATIFVDQNTIHIDNNEPDNIVNLRFLNIENVKFTASLQTALNESAIKSKFEDWSLILISLM